MSNMFTDDEDSDVDHVQNLNELSQEEDNDSDVIEDSFEDSKLGSDHDKQNPEPKTSTPLNGRGLSTFQNESVIKFRRKKSYDVDADGDSDETDSKSQNITNAMTSRSVNFIEKSFTQIQRKKENDIESDSESERSQSSRSSEDDPVYEESFHVMRKKKHVIVDTDDESDTSSVDNARRTIQKNNSVIADSNDDSDSSEIQSSSVDNARRTIQKKKHAIVYTDDDYRRNPTIDAGKVDASTESIVVSTGGDDDRNIIDVSSDEENDAISQRTIQPTIDTFYKKQEKNDTPGSQSRKNVTIQENATKTSAVQCTPVEYKVQQDKIKQFEKELLQTKKLLTSLNLNQLPDNGKMLVDRFKHFQSQLKIEHERLKSMVITNEGPKVEPTVSTVETVRAKWQEFHEDLATHKTKHLGKKGLENFNMQKALTAECLEQLHGSLDQCPAEDHFASDPSGLNISLMPHQKRALKWLVFREKQKPRGGILADDMGLGKTLTIISLIMKQLDSKDDVGDECEDEDDSSRNEKCKAGTLVVCPASLLHQWSGEIDKRLKRGRLSYYIFHGPKREEKPKRLAQYDVVITTYSIVSNESNKGGVLSRMYWQRIVLDEAHQIRNYKSLTAIAVCSLAGRSRWALTGTPIHNKDLDMYSLIKFLRCAPFDDLAVWKRWVSDKSTGGGERLHAVISSLMLRRTKAELIGKGTLKDMPVCKWELIQLTLEKSEMNIYEKVLIFSRTLFAQFLHQRAEKNQDRFDLNSHNRENADPNGEYFKMRQRILKLNKVKDVSQHEILVLLLRLRQICCHPALITSMLQGDEDLGDAEPEHVEEMNLLEQLNKLDINQNDNNSESFSGLSDQNVGLKEATKGMFSTSNPVFSRESKSTKVKAVLDFLPKVLSTGDKVIIVSQWTSYLELLAIHLRVLKIKFKQLNGSIPTSKRMDIVDAINDPDSRTKVLLLSLTAGGVGLNLVGANHLFLLDLHWNPQLENQAQDRIYRVGQKKPVFIYKFMTLNTIEERIKGLQDKKLGMADGILEGTNQVTNSKLTLHDLKNLFGM